VEFPTVIPYPAEIERQMRVFFDSLSEKDRRRYAAVEAAKLGHGGVEYVVALLGCDPKTVRRGREDVEQLPFDELAGRVRRRRSSVSCFEMAGAAGEVVLSES
jgi:hypothetical protein